VPFVLLQGNVRAIVVDPKLRVLGVEEQGSVYALGDCATVARSSLLNDFKDSFEAHDTDEDGSLEAVELQACLDDIRIRNPHAGRFLNKAATMMKEFDTNGDGRLDRKEFDTLLKHIDRRHRSLPPTAAVAQQQAVYLSAVLNAEASAMAGGTAQQPPKDFEFHSRGQAAYVGKNVSIIGIGEDAKLIMADGYGFTYLVWRAMYLSMVPDVRSMAAISYGWLSTVVFGRDSGVW
jgi:NADH:ubiquinone reductase (H+-translocating)